MICDFPDGFFPYEGRRIKNFFEDLKADFSPDVVFTHQRADLHRITGCLRADLEHLPRPPDPRVRGAEVRRDMSAPNAFVPLSEGQSRRKIEHLMEHFASQRSKHWFREDLFSSLLRLRGMECNSPSSHAEAFFCRKAVLA